MGLPTPLESHLPCPTCRSKSQSEMSLGASREGRCSPRGRGLGGPPGPGGAAAAVYPGAAGELQAQRAR